MKFKSRKDCVCNGVKVYKDQTVVEFPNDVSDNFWYRVDVDEPRPKVTARPRIPKPKK